MDDLPNLWDEYARLQGELARRNRLTSSTWGLEAGLNRLLTEPPAIPTQEDAARAVRSASRKERYRSALRLVWVRPDPPPPPPEMAIHARRQLRLIKDQVTSGDWVLLEALGDGADYAELATATSLTNGALRGRVFRLRRRLRGVIEREERTAAK